MKRIDALVGEFLGTSVPAAREDPELELRVRRAVAASGRKIVALDDDPTGVQTVHDVPVLAQWDAATLAAELRRPESLFFVLTNSRSLPEAQAIALNQEIAGNLSQASRVSGVGFSVASRGDSTLRGHFPAETDALGGALGGVDGVLLCPAFFEGGRVTAGDVHCIQDGDRLVPVAQTEFARDTSFGYQSRTLPEWITEKSRGRLGAGSIRSLSLDEIRLGGVTQVAAQLRALHDAQVLVINALAYSDLWIVTLGVLQAEAEGRRFLYRCGASFVRARAGILDRSPLTRAELLGSETPAPASGLVIVGSHVQRTSDQLTRLLALPGASGIELRVGRVLDNAHDRGLEIERVRERSTQILRSGAIAVVYTSRVLERRQGLDDLTVARQVSDALVAVVRELPIRPDFVVGKGGITSSDIGTRGLGATRAIVLGQVRPGVPVWRLGAESRFPELPYVVFPGNVGGPESLADVVAELRGELPNWCSESPQPTPRET